MRVINNPERCCCTWNFPQRKLSCWKQVPIYLYATCLLFETCCQIFFIFATGGKTKFSMFIYCEKTMSEFSTWRSPMAPLPENFRGISLTDYQSFGFSFFGAREYLCVECYRSFRYGKRPTPSGVSENWFWFRITVILTVHLLYLIYISCSSNAALEMSVCLYSI